MAHVAFNATLDFSLCTLDSELNPDGTLVHLNFTPNNPDLTAKDLERLHEFINQVHLLMHQATQYGG